MHSYCKGVGLLKGWLEKDTHAAGQHRVSKRPPPALSFQELPPKALSDYTIDFWQGTIIRNPSKSSKRAIQPNLASASFTCMGEGMLRLVAYLPQVRQ